jgi:uncharacterized RDD family membrane protein YckC
MSKSKKSELPRRLLTSEELAALPRAGLLRRLAALLYDMFLVAAMWLCLGYVIIFGFGFFAENTSELVDGQIVTHPILSFLQLVMMVSTVTGFYVWFWHRTGQTLGMIAWRIRALSVDNQPLSLRQGLLRFVLAWPSFWLLGAGYLWIFIDRQRDALHEKLSASKTVLLPKHARPF